MNTPQKGAVSIAVVVISVLVVGVVGYIVFVNRPASQPNVEPSPLGTAASTESPLPSPSPSISAAKTPAPQPTLGPALKPEGNTIGWYDYTNARYEFQLKFKPGWEVGYYGNPNLIHPKPEGLESSVKIDSQNANEIDIKGCGCVLQLEETTSGSLEAYRAELGKGYHIVSTKYISVAGVAALDIQAQLQGSYRRQIHFVRPDPVKKGIYNRYVFYLDYTGQPVASPDFELMVATMRFLR